MARLFDEIFHEGGTGDIKLIFNHTLDNAFEERSTLYCHSLILTQFPYFLKMLSVTSPLREGRSREVLVTDPREDVIEIVRFIYTSNIEITHVNVGGLVTLADKYCIDEVLELCLKFVRENFDADAFFNFYNFTAVNSAFQERLKEHLMTALKERRNLCLMTEDARWCELPVENIEEILSMDELPISSETEVLTFIANWGNGGSKDTTDVARLMGSFRRCDNLRIPISEIETLMQALGYDLFNRRSPRTGSALWDPPLVIHRHEAAGNISHAETAVLALAEKQDAHQNEIYHQLGPKDYLQQEPGWMHAGVHRCSVTLKCTCWFHRERRLLRSSRSIEAAVPMHSKRVFESHVPAKATGHERSPSPPPKFQVRMPPIEAFDTFDPSQMPDILESERFLGGGGGVSRNISQDKIDHELVDHHIICCVVSGQQRHGVRFSQRDPNGIYLAEDLGGKRGINIGGTTSSITVDLELVIGEASKNGISRCRFAVLREMQVLLEECFDVSAKVPLRFYISSASFDSNSNYTVTAQWHPPSS